MLKRLAVVVPGPQLQDVIMAPLRGVILKDHMTQGLTTAVTLVTMTTVEEEVVVVEVATTTIVEADETTTDLIGIMTAGVTASGEDMRAVTMIEVATEVKGAVGDTMTEGTKFQVPSLEWTLMF